VVGGGVRKSGEGLVCKTTPIRSFAQKFYTKVCFTKCMNVLPVASGLARPFRDLQETEGLFRKMTKDSVARHVPLGALWCEQRAVGFKNSD
jgi:hypothetical protein